MTPNILSIVIPSARETKGSVINQNEGVALLGFYERFMHRTRCGNGSWSRPFNLRRMQHSEPRPGMIYPEGFDSHQVCTQCGTQRYFDSKTWKAGALFFRRSR
jgi:hypothetical protein